VTDQLKGARLFTLPETETTDLLKLLHAAEPAKEPSPDDATAQDPPDPVGDSDFITVADEPALPESASDAPAQTETSVPRLDQQTIVDSPAGAVPLHLQVFGRLRLIHHAGDQERDIIDALAPRQREILVYLALHRDGVRRDTLTAALWPEAPGDRPHNSFHATLSQLRKALRQATGETVANLTMNDDGHYLLDPALVTADLWQVQDALAEQRSATGPARIAALRRVADVYSGDLAAEITAQWIEAPREALRRDVLGVLSTLIHETATEDPQQTLALLERARSLDPYNEAIYRDLMRTQARLGQHDAVPRTLNLLTRSLAELDLQPTRDTLELAETLRRGHRKWDEQPPHRTGSSSPADQNGQINAKQGLG
jgi:DNA-binding SARP family transcriptional activator